MRSRDGRFLAGHGLRLWHQYVSILLIEVMVFVPALLAMQDAAWAGGNAITPDGRTGTQVHVSGAQTDITTTTMSGGNAFNSFSHFEVGAGNTVNLHVPGSANNLVNLVWDAPIRIDGILNAYKNGQIGGNVHFADPYGMVVGQSGVINVGSLTVTTPTREFMEQMLAPDGVISNPAVEQLLKGAMPISQDGVIAIHGRINAAESVRIFGHDVSLGAEGAHVPNDSQAQGGVFASTVNSGGLESGGEIVASDGGIEIVAAGTAKLAGKLTANGSAGRKAGTIKVNTGKDITVSKGAVVSAKGQGANSDGGRIEIKAGGDLHALDGSVYVAAAGETGKGGFIELSAKNKAGIGDVKIDLSAAGGKAGALLIDPFDLEVDNATTWLMPGVDVTLQADNSITIKGTGVVDTRMIDAGGVSTGNSGSITVTAPTIIVEAGGKLLAGVNNQGGTTYTAGNISLIASHSVQDTLAGGYTEANASISVAGLIDGGNIYMGATAEAVSKYTDDVADIALFGGQVAAGYLTGLNGGYLEAVSNASVVVESGANISGTGDVTLYARGVEEASDPIVVITSAKKVAASIVYGSVGSDIEAAVRSGATISAGGALAVKATNDAKLGVLAMTIADNSTADGAGAYGAADIGTISSIDGGAVISDASSVAVLARNDNSFQTSASVLALGSSQVGVAIAVSNYNSTASAHLGANLGSLGNEMGNVTVEADSITEKNITKATTEVGDGLVSGIVKRAALAGIAPSPARHRVLSAARKPGRAGRPKNPNSARPSPSRPTFKRPRRIFQRTA